MKLCYRIQGEVGTLTIDQDYAPEKFKLPIDAPIVSLIKDINEDGEG